MKANDVDLRPTTLSMFTLVSATQDFCICLRCQYRLSLRQRHRPSRRWPTEYPQKLQHYATGVGLKQEPSSAHDTATDDGISGRAPIRYSSDVLHPNQHYKHGNGPPAIKDSIGFNALGEPAEVLILRDKKKRFELESALAKIHASGPDENPTAETISSSEMLEKMDAERGLIDLDEVCKNIESMKTLWTAKKKSSGPSAAYGMLAVKLQQGFTKQQLGAYYDRARVDLAADKFDLDVEFSSMSYARSSWQPLGKTQHAAIKIRAPKLLELVLEEENQEKLSEEAPLRIAPSEKSLSEMDASEKASSTKEALQNQTRQGVNKKTIVRSILRECWNFRPRGQESPQGQLDIRLRESDLKLILNHKRDILKLISKSYDSKVEAWPQAPIVRITSDYDNCVDVIKILISTIKNIKVSTVDLDDNSMSRQGSTSAPGKLNKTILGQLEAYTNTLVEPLDGSFKALRVSYLGPDDTDLSETRRLIYQILRPGCSHTTRLAWSKDEETIKASLVPVHVGSKMSLLNRNQEWSRWCDPHDGNQVARKEKIDDIPLSSLLAAPETQAEQLHGVSGVRAAKSFFAMPDDSIYKHCKPPASFWASEIEYHDSVKFGQILFPTKFASSTADAIRKSINRTKAGGNIGPISNREIGLLFMNRPREFVPLVPGLVHSLGIFQSLKERDDFVQIRLSPSPKNLSLPVPVSALPDLEIRVSFGDESKATSIKDVRLVNRLEKDFLQPHRIVDLRLIREQHVYARNDEIDPCITAFVQNSDLNLQGTERLKTPAGLSLSIPSLAVYPHKDFVPEKHDTLLVDYTSLGLEIRSSVTVPYEESNSWPTLTYTSVEAGRVGGRRDELSLNRVRFTSDSPPMNDKEFDFATLGGDTPSSLYNGLHTSILFQKTAALIETVEGMGGKNGAGANTTFDSDFESSVDMAGLNRVRHVTRRKVRRVQLGSKDDNNLDNRIRKVVQELLARRIPGGERAGSADQGGPSVPS